MIFQENVENEVKHLTVEDVNKLNKDYFKNFEIGPWLTMKILKTSKLRKMIIE